MSLYGFDILRCDGKLFAYARIQNDYTGNVAGFKKAFGNQLQFICINEVTA